MAGLDGVTLPARLQPWLGALATWGVEFAESGQWIGAVSPGPSVLRWLAGGFAALALLPRLDTLARHAEPSRRDA